jgi:hypothetical protein
VKICTVCVESKSYSEFHKNNKAADGYSFRCRTCTSAYYKGYNASRKAAVARVEVKSKVCRECGLEKPISQFGKKSTSLDKYNIYCKPCWRIRCAKAMRKMYANGR